MCCVVTVFILSIEYRIEQVEVLPCPTRSMGAGDHAEPLYLRNKLSARSRNISRLSHGLCMARILHSCLPSGIRIIRLLHKKL